MNSINRVLEPAVLVILCGFSFGVGSTLKEYGGHSRELPNAQNHTDKRSFVLKPTVGDLVQLVDQHKQGTGFRTMGNILNLRKALFELAEMDPKACIEWIDKNLLRAQLEDVLNHAVIVLLHRNRKECIEFLTILPDAFGADLRSLCATEIAKTRPKEAILLIREGFVHPSDVDNVLRTVSSSDPTVALGYCLDEFPQGRRRDAKLSVCVDEWAKRDVDELRKWITESDFPLQDKNELLLRAVSAVTEDRPELAYDILASYEGTGGMHKDLLRRIMLSWAGTHEQEALSFIAEIENPIDREEAFSAAAWKLSWNDKDRVVDFAPKFSSKGTRDKFLYDFGKRRSEIEGPQAIATWASGIESTDTRLRILQGTLAQWIESAPKAAAEFLSNQDDPTDFLRAMDLSRDSPASPQ